MLEKNKYHDKQIEESEKQQTKTMIKQTLRQAWTMMKQHRLFTGIYIAGTALSVTMIMITFAVLYIKFGPIYPEENRDRMLVMTHIYCRGLNPRYDNHAFHCSPKLAELIKKGHKLKQLLTIQ